MTPRQLGGVGYQAIGDIYLTAQTASVVPLGGRVQRWTRCSSGRDGSEVTSLPEFMTPC